MINWLKEYSQQAVAEGWDIFEHDSRGLEIERIDDPYVILEARGQEYVLKPEDEQPVFLSDDAAIYFVVRNAEHGSEMHRAALAYIAYKNPKELKKIYRLFEI